MATIYRYYIILSSMACYPRRRNTRDNHPRPMRWSSPLMIDMECLLLPPFAVEEFSFSWLTLFYLQFLVAQLILIYLPWCWSIFPAFLGSMSHVVRPLCLLSFYHFSNLDQRPGFFVVFTWFPTNSRWLGNSCSAGSEPFVSATVRDALPNMKTL